MLTKVEMETCVKNAVKASVKEELGPYKIPKEQHWKDHSWVKATRKTTGLIWKVFITTSAITFIGLIYKMIALGLREHFKKG